jgi:hypothetical protein
MGREVTAAERAAAPYSQIGLMVAIYADGSYTLATCALVGRNDILTATSPLYDPVLGWATDLQFYVGADFTQAAGNFDSYDASYVLTGGFSWTAQGYPAQVYANADNGTMTRQEAAYDVAVIGVSVPIGDTLGWLGMEPGFNYNGEGVQVGYPVGTTGMQTGNIGYFYSEVLPGVHMYEWTGAGNMGPGSTGGPLLQGNSVIGVKSVSSNLTGFWADINTVYSDIIAYIQSDNGLMGTPGIVNDTHGTVGHDVFISTFSDDYYNGAQGTDTVIYRGARGDYTIALNNGVVSVEDNVAQRDGHDVLTGVERISFSDYNVAFDVDGAAGQAYRLYKAAFDRAPDLPGLGYQMNALDQGYSLSQVAAAFIASPEFQTTYGEVDDTAFITLLYWNVLDRAPDAGGLQFHLDEMHVYGESRADVLTHFSESPENKANVIGSIAGGMTYVF